MKKLLVALLLISSVNIIGFERDEREKKVTFNTLTSTPTGSAIQRTQERASFDSIFEPKLRPNCANNCVCFECLEKACCELEKMQNKLPYLELIKKNKEDQPLVAIAAARMMARIVVLYEEGQTAGLIKNKDISKSEKKSKKSEKKLKKEKTDPKKSSSSRNHRLTTPSDKREGE